MQPVKSSELDGLISTHGSPRRYPINTLGGPFYTLIGL